MATISTLTTPTFRGASQGTRPSGEALPQIGGARAPTATASVEYRVVHALVFAVCLALALLLRLAPRAWHPWLAPSERRMSLVAEARAAADSTVPYVFQVA